MRKYFLVYILCFCAGCFSCRHDSKNTREVSLSVVAEIGIEEAKTKEEEPYQFSYIRSVDCDEVGNIYVLDHIDVCVKVFDMNGTFLRQILSEGEGPYEIMNPYGVRINEFRNSLFVLHEHGYQLKEFDIYGSFIKQYKLTEQIVHNFDFLDINTLVYASQERPPPPDRRTLKMYRYENSELVEAGSFPDLDFFIEIETCWHNRIITSSSAYDLVPKIVILEVQLN